MVQNSRRPVIVRLTGCTVPGELVPLENFTYSNEFMGCVIRWNLERTDFVGVSVRQLYCTKYYESSRIPYRVELLLMMEVLEYHLI